MTPATIRTGVRSAVGSSCNPRVERVTNETPNTRPQTPKKLQTPNLKPSGALPFWSPVFEDFLGFSAWSLAFHHVGPTHRLRRHQRRNRPRPVACDQFRWHGRPPPAGGLARAGFSIVLQRRTVHGDHIAGSG